MMFRVTQKSFLFVNRHEIHKINNRDLIGTTWEKSTVEISQNFVAFSEYMNFTDFQCSNKL